MTNSSPQNGIQKHSDQEKMRLCAANNADLYQAKFRAHGLPDQRTSAFWSSYAIAPPYYSNMTTLDPDATEVQLIEIDRLTDRLGRRLGIKDGFSKLDLNSHGFRLLFSASWIWAEPHETLSSAPRGWVRVSDVVELDHWERSWKESGSQTNANVFTPALLSDSNIHIYGRLADGGFDAGCIVNRSPEVVGISNIFCLSGTPKAFQDAALLASIASAGLPVVGYDSGEALDEMKRQGFKTVGLLRIWLSDERA